MSPMEVEISICGPVMGGLVGCCIAGAGGGDAGASAGAAASAGAVLWPGGGACVALLSWASAGAAPQSSRAAVNMVIERIMVPPAVTLATLCETKKPEAMTPPAFVNLM